LAKKHKGEDWDPKAVKVVISTLKKIRKRQMEEGQSAKARGASTGEERAKKVIGKEAEKPQKQQTLTPERIVTKNEELRRQLSVQLNPTRFKR
jgi:hypothetical protein